MLLVIWGHITNADLFFVVTSPIKIPLFFAITGYVFNEQNGSLIKFAKKQWEGIFIPWLCLSFVWLKVARAIVFDNIDLALNYLYDFISGRTYWFMPCILLANLFHFCLRKIKVQWLQILLMTFMTIMGLFLGRYEIGSFAMFNTACASQGFMMFGFLFRRYESRVLNYFKPWVLYIAGFIYLALVAMSIVYYPGQSMDVHNNVYYSYMICGSMILIGLLMLFAIFSRMVILPKWVIIVGQNTLTFYMLHYYVRRGLKNLFYCISDLSSVSIGRDLLEFFIICAVLTPVSYVLSKWLPFAVGKRRI